MQALVPIGFILPLPNNLRTLEEAGLSITLDENDFNYLGIKAERQPLLEPLIQRREAARSLTGKHNRFHLLNLFIRARTNQLAL